MRLSAADPVHQSIAGLSPGAESGPCLLLDIADFIAVFVEAVHPSSRELGCFASEP